MPKCAVSAVSAAAGSAISVSLSVVRTRSGKPRRQPGEQRVLDQPADRRDLQVGLADEVLGGHSRPRQPVAKLFDQQVADPVAAPHPLARDRAEIGPQRRVEQQRAAAGRTVSIALARLLVRFDGLITTASPAANGRASSVSASSSTLAAPPASRRAPSTRSGR